MLQSLWDDFKGVEINTPPKKVGVTVTEAALEKIASMCLENNMEAVRPYVMGGRMWRNAAWYDFRRY